MEINNREREVIIEAIVKEADAITARKVSNEREKKLSKYFSPDYLYSGVRVMGGEKLTRGTNLAGCGICVSRAAYKLDKGMTFKEMKDMIHKKHPEFKDLDRYTQRFIRFVTGDGYDEWIIQNENRMWKVRNPVMFPNQKIRWLIGMRWRIFVQKGEEIYETLHRLNTDQYTEEEINEHLAFCTAYGIMKEGVDK